MSIYMSPYDIVHEFGEEKRENSTGKVGTES